MKLRLILAALTCLTLPLAAHAQPIAGPYIALEGGASIQNPIGYSTNIGAVSLAGKAQYRPSYAGIATLGYAFGDGFRIQIDTDDLHSTLHKLDDTTYGQFRASGAHSVYGPMLNVLYDIPLGLRVTPYVGAGGGYQWIKADARTTVSGRAYASAASRGSPAYDVIAGLSYPIAAVPGLSLTAEYRFQQLLSKTDAHWRLVCGCTKGTGKYGQESSHNFLIGFSYALFQPAAAVAPMAAPPPAAPPMAAPAPAPIRTFIVFFDWDRASLTPRATEIISEAASDSKTASVTTLNVSGYTDTSGTPDYNMGLSQRRAESVATQLETDGVPSSEIEIHAYGETHLLVQTGPGVREPQNRRVEIVLQ